MVIIAPLFVFWLSKSHKGVSRGMSMVFRLKLINFLLLSFAWAQQCWETAIGQEIYRFVIIDFLLVGCVGALYHLIRFALCKYVWPQIGLPEFSISRSSLGLIFNQTLLWIGLFFSPILGAILIIKMILIFYLRVSTPPILALCRSIYSLSYRFLLHRNSFWSISVSHRRNCGDRLKHRRSFWPWPLSRLWSQL